MHLPGSHNQSQLPGRWISTPQLEVRKASKWAVHASNSVCRELVVWQSTQGKYDGQLSNVEHQWLLPWPGVFDGVLMARCSWPRSCVPGGKTFALCKVFRQLLTAMCTQAGRAERAVRRAVRRRRRRMPQHGAGACGPRRGSAAGGAAGGLAALVWRPAPGRLAAGTCPYMFLYMFIYITHSGLAACAWATRSRHMPLYTLHYTYVVYSSLAACTWASRCRHVSSSLLCSGKKPSHTGTTCCRLV